MVAPSLSLNQIVSTFNLFPQANINSDIPDVFNGYSASGSTLVLSGNVVGGTTYFFEVIFPSGAIDATDTSWHSFLYTFAASSSIRFGLGSGAGNYRMWNNAGLSSNFRHIDIPFDISKSTTIPDTGTFNIAAVDRIRFEIQFGNNENKTTLIRLRGIPFYWNNATQGFKIVGGDTLNPLRIASIYDLRQSYINDQPYSNQITYISILGGTDLAQWLIPVEFGDITTTAVADNGLLLSASNENNESAPLNTIDTNIDSSGWINGFTGLTPAGYTFRNVNIPFFWRELGANTWSRLNLDGATTVDLGLSNYESCLFVGLSATTVGGKSVVAEWKDSTASIVYEWKENSDGSYPDLSGSTFNSPSATHYIDIPAVGVAFPATLDVSAVTFTSLPAGNKIFRTNVPVGETLTIIVPAGSGYTLAANVQEDGAGTTGGGSVTVVSPPATIRVIGFPTGSTVIVSQAGIQLNLLNNATAPYNYVTGSGDESGSIYNFKVIAAGKDDFTSTLDITESTVVQYIGVDAGSEQTLDTPLFAFRELMGSDLAFLRITGGDLSLNTQLWEQANWQSEWNAAVVSDGPSAAEISTWAGYLATAGYVNISFVITTDGGRVAGEVN